MQIVALIALAYLLSGVAVALPFAFKAVNRLDGFAVEGSLGFRLAILPGAVALWPVVLARWVSGGQPRPEANAHRRAVGHLDSAGGPGR